MARGRNESVPMNVAALGALGGTLPPPEHAPLAPVLGALVLILVGGRLSGIAFERMRLPAVIGELLAGIVLGNVGWLGWHGLEPLLAAPALDVLAQIGILFLLFQVGLDADL